MRGKTADKHNKACIAYREAFMDREGYAFCEICRRSDAFKYEVHHIYYASHYPKHLQLHNPRNLIHICTACHTGLHAGEKKDTFERLEKERGLKELFSELC